MIAPCSVRLSRHLFAVVQTSTTQSDRIVNGPVCAIDETVYYRTFSVASMKRGIAIKNDPCYVLSVKCDLQL